ncbi:MAG: acyloxyacyl hydrolase [Acidithiobacillus sp.]
MHHTFVSVRQWLRILCGFTLFLAASSAWAVTLMPSGTPYLSAGVGVFNLVGAVDDDGYNHTPAELNVEYQSGFRFYGIGYMLGVLANTDGGVDGYGGVYADLALTPHWILTPEAAVSGYSQGNSKKMGSTFLFRLELGLAYQMDNGGRLGLKIAHLSNADIYPRNPGENEFLVTYSFPLG